MNTTKRYVHPNEADIREATEKVKVGLEKGVVASLDRPLPVVEEAAFVERMRNSG